MFCNQFPFPALFILNHNLVVVESETDDLVPAPLDEAAFHNVSDFKPVMPTIVLFSHIFGFLICTDITVSACLFRVLFIVFRLTPLYAKNGKTTRYEYHRIRVPLRA